MINWLKNLFKRKGERLSTSNIQEAYKFLNEHPFGRPDTVYYLDYWDSEININAITWTFNENGWTGKVNQPIRRPYRRTHLFFGGKK